MGARTSGILAGLLVAAAASFLVGRASRAGEEAAADSPLFPPGSVVLILHADDGGMCPEANRAIARYLEARQIQSASVMMPCPAAREAALWCSEHPGMDIGIHATLTSEWKSYRWGPVLPPGQVPGLLDPEGCFFRTVEEVVRNASMAEVAAEVRAQVQAARDLGFEPTHIDSHMGTLYATPGFFISTLATACRLRIPFPLVRLTPETKRRLREKGVAVTPTLERIVASAPFPKLDSYSGVPGGDSYEQVRGRLMEKLASLEPGIHLVFFHPSDESERLKRITNSWRQRVWESRLFADPEVRRFLEEQGFLFTDWGELMARYRESRQGK